MDPETHGYPSQLFTLRLWQEEVAEGVTEWRGQLRHVTSGQIHYFREWHALINLLLAVLAEQTSPQDPS